MSTSQHPRFRGRVTFVPGLSRGPHGGKSGLTPAPSACGGSSVCGVRWGPSLILPRVDPPSPALGAGNPVLPLPGVWAPWSRATRAGGRGVFPGGPGPSPGRRIVRRGHRDRVQHPLPRNTWTLVFAAPLLTRTSDSHTCILKWPPAREERTPGQASVSSRGGQDSASQAAGALAGTGPPAPRHPTPRRKGRRGEAPLQEDGAGGRGGGGSAEAGSAQALQRRQPLLRIGAAPTPSSDTSVLCKSLGARAPGELGCLWVQRCRAPPASLRAGELGGRPSAESGPRALSPRAPATGTSRDFPTTRAAPHTASRSRFLSHSAHEPVCPRVPEDGGRKASAASPAGFWALSFTSGA